MDSMASNNPQQAEPITFDNIQKCFVNRFGEEGDDTDQNIYDSFVPREAILSLTESDRVRLTLDNALNRPQDVQKLTQYVVSSAGRVFLTLIYSDAIEYIRDLQKAGFTDNDLPVYTKPSRDHSRVLIHRWRVNDTSPYADKKHLPCFLNWSAAKLDGFFQNQWIFLAPVFSQDKFAHVFYRKSRLPYVPTQGSDTSSGAGYFGMIRKRGLHNEHHKYQSLSKDQETDQETKRHIQVAVKTLTIQSSTATDVDKFYTKEQVTLEKMRDLNHSHLIKAVAAYRKGDDRCFVFPWAQEGSLWDFWRNHSASLDKDLVSWAIGQMVGLSDGLRRLHYSDALHANDLGQLRHTGTRHGDIKPDNILCFVSGNEMTLVLADVGLAKYHRDYTRDRTKATTTRHGSRIYEPPEMSTDREKIVVSRKYDVWSLGCVFLEFTIWLLYGRSGLDLFHSKLLNNPGIDRFWEDDTNGKPQIHSVARRWLDKILTKDLKGHSALRDMVELIDKWLLVPKIDERTTTKDLFPKIETIRSKCSENRQYLFNHELEELAKNMSASDVKAEKTMPHPSKEVA